MWEHAAPDEERPLWAASCVNLDCVADLDAEAFDGLAPEHDLAGGERRTPFDNSDGNLATQLGQIERRHGQVIDLDIAIVAGGDAADIVVGAEPIHHSLHGDRPELPVGQAVPSLAIARRRVDE